MVERAARVVFGMAVLLIIAAMVCGCSLHDVQYPFSAAAAKPAPEPPEDIEINLNAANPAAPRVTAVASTASAPAPVPAPAASAPGMLPEYPSPVVKGDPVDVPAPELENVNRYARALENKLRQRYNNTPAFAGKVGKVQLLPVGEPQVSLDGRKMRMEWSQIVFDEWGRRIPELEKEFYVVTFGDGKPLMQRTRPTITVGLNNEGGYSEFAPVRGGKLSARATVGDPAMYDRPDSDRRGLLDDNLARRDSAPQEYDFLDLPEIRDLVEQSEKLKDRQIPVIPPVGEHLTAVTVNE